MKKFIKVIGITSIFIFILFFLIAIFIAIHMGKGGSLSRFPPGYSITSIVVSGILTRFISSKVWKRKEQL
jgi:ABC-type antimicrobial peptide transport system permease subunit